MIFSSLFIGASDLPVFARTVLYHPRLWYNFHIIFMSNDNFQRIAITFFQLSFKKTGHKQYWNQSVWALIEMSIDDGKIKTMMSNEFLD